MHCICAVAVPFAESHICHSYSEHAGLDSLGSLDNGVEGGSGSLRAGEPVSVAGIVQDDEGLGGTGRGWGMVNV